MVATIALPLISDRRRAGFTLIEILVAMAIIGIVSSIATYSLFNAFEKARQRSTMADIRGVANAVEAYSLDSGLPPTASGNWQELIDNLTPIYAKHLPDSDHWKNGYTYSSDGTGGYTIESFGRDGIDGANISISSRFNFDLDIVLVNGQFIAVPQ
jgi:general secretion pathway protein G